MKKQTGRVEGEDFNFEDFIEDLKVPPTDLWVRYLMADHAMLTDFQRYLGREIARAQSHAVNLRGPEMKDDLLRLQGGIRAIATIRLFVSNFLKESGSGRVAVGMGGADGRRLERTGTNSRTG